VKAFSDLFAEEFNTQREQWETTLKSELKLTEVAGKTSKMHFDLGNWPTLSLKAHHTHQLSSATSWKKSAQTYFNIERTSIESSLLDDLAGGARVFFFDKDFFNKGDWDLIERILQSSSCSAEIEVYLLGQSGLKINTALKVFDENQMILGREAHENGGHNVHELALMTCKLIESADYHPSHVGIYVDSHFFKNIAKVRAAKLLIQKVYKEIGLTQLPKIMTLNSYREWTLFERYSNMLRNNVQVASGYVSGADVVQSSGYQLIFDLETSLNQKDHNERSQRMARNTSHILALESMLGVVEDAAAGSFHLENLSDQYAESAWKLMQVLLASDPIQRKDFLNTEILKVQELRQTRVKNRKDVLAGINDYPDGKELLGISLKKGKAFRVARIFEEIRLQVETLSKKPKVAMLIQGDVSVLSNRMNFVKNYFELIGLEVFESTQANLETENTILVLCAKDEDYLTLSKQHENDLCLAKYVAGKVELPGFVAIHAGQDVYAILSQLVTKIVGMK
jgi:hypothetical protein